MNIINAVKTEFVSGNIFIRPNHLHEVGDGVDGHTHNFDHTTYVVTGSVHVIAKKDGVVIGEKDFKAGEWFLVKAEVNHQIVALEPNTLFHCIYSHRNAQGDVVQQYTGWEKGNH